MTSLPLPPVMVALAVGSIAKTLASPDKVVETDVKFCTVTDVCPELKVKYCTLDAIDAVPELDTLSLTVRPAYVLLLPE